MSNSVFCEGFVMI